MSRLRARDAEEGEEVGESKRGVTGT
jgi:hypothetical protein